MRARFLILISIVVSMAATTAAECCTIPVFRFALDRWESDRFRLVLPPQVAEQAEVIDLLRPLRASGRANLNITTARDGSVPTPTLYFPSASATNPVWTGKLDDSALTALLDSPARKQLRQHILDGTSVTWVLVDAGMPADDATASRIEKRLKFLEQAAALPIQDPNDPDSQLGPGPALKLSFATMRLKLNDASEQTLIRMLVGPDAKIDPTKPFAAAVFARGRVLGAWELGQFDDSTLEDACMFLIGRCSCRVKNENPGWDLLMDVDWEKALREVPASFKSLPQSATTTMSGLNAPTGAPETSRIDAPTSTRPSPPSQPMLSSSYVIGGAGVLIILSILFLRKNARHSH